MVSPFNFGVVDAGSVTASRSDLIASARSAKRSRSRSGMLHKVPEEEVERDDKTRTELEAATFRALVAHLRERTDVQNIDLMNLAGFCRNCLSKWYRAAAEEKGVALSDPEAREIVYGMPYDEWRKQHQKEASAERGGGEAGPSPGGGERVADASAGAG